MANCCGPQDCGEAKTASCCGEKNRGDDAKTSSCCGEQNRGDAAKAPSCSGASPPPYVDTDSKLTWRDIAGRWKARWGIGRMNFRVQPGLYALNQPGRNAPILVTANYKMTFDILRRDLAGQAAWILVLDSKGVNVWCAAGKGTFGTAELVQRLRQVDLPRFVDHRRLTLPQLGGPGIAAYRVRQATGFTCDFGPVRSADLPAYLQAGGHKTARMAQVDFPLMQRLALVPMELVPALRLALPVLGVFFLVNLFLQQPLAWPELVAYGGGIVFGCVLLPLLLPWLPGRAFGVKGYLLGLVWTAFLVAVLLPAWQFPAPRWQIAGYFLILPALTASYALFFTGSTPVTSLAGVQWELRRLAPWLVFSLSLGIVCTLGGRL